MQYTWIKYLLGLLLVGLLGMGSARAAQENPARLAAQQSTPTSSPTIVQFSSDLETITLTEAESGNTFTILHWVTIGMGESYYLALEYYQLGQWQPVFVENPPVLSPSSSIEVPVRHTLDFEPPAFRLSVLNVRNELQDEWLLTLPYAETSDTPTIEQFAVQEASIEFTALAQETIQITAQWQINHRRPTTQLVFEQLLDDGSVVNVELPRPELWIPSVGDNGLLAPVLPLERQEIVLRLSVIDLVTDEIYDTAETTVEVVGTWNPPPPQPTNPTTNPSNTPDTSASPQITAFSVTPLEIERGGSITVTWESVGTTSVAIDIIEMPTFLNQSSESAFLQENLPTAGTITFTVPERVQWIGRVAIYPVNPSFSDAYYGAPPLIQDVQIRCLYPFVVDVGEGGCALNPAETVNAASQSFERGTMLWRGDTGTIYVLAQGVAYYFYERDYAGLPDAVPGETPPAGLVAPVSGFGKVWANYPHVREALGWATAAEFSYSMTRQDVLVPPDWINNPIWALMTLPNGQWVGYSTLQTWRYLP